MNAAIFDKLAYIEHLKQAGFDESQARAQAFALNDALHESVATKTDMLQNRVDLDLLRKDVHQTIKAELADFRAEIFKWAVPVIMGQAAFIVGLMKIFA
jgi:lipopolysaccharide export LptBFGC system permease protein LptF